MNMDNTDNRMEYELRLVSKASGVGYFSCCPKEDMGIDACLAYLRTHLYDDFMHKYVLDKVCECDTGALEQIIQQAWQDPVLLPILCEAVFSSEKFGSLRTNFDREKIAVLSSNTPLIYLKSILMEDRQLHNQWITYFAQNILEHKPLDSLGTTALPFPFPDELLSSNGPAVHIKQILKHGATNLSSGDATSWSPETTAQNALERMEAIGTIAGSEMKHSSSLSPFGFYRKWHLNLSVNNANHNYTLSGIQTSFGRGLHQADARASYAMEMVERYSSFASFDQHGAVGFTRGYPLILGSYRELQHVPALDPNSLGLEVPYEGDPLYWIEGDQVTNCTSKSMLVPVQSVFLFCNLQEISLFSGLGSTGLASGNSLEQAKLSGLLEVIERDAEATSLYDLSRCFKLDAEDSSIASLLADYTAKGIQLQFQDISHEFGIPCYKCFVIGPQGQVIKGTGAHLDGKKALLSALTETPYPYPNGPASSSGPNGISTVLFEDLPDYSSGDPRQDLATLETVLNANGYQPVYVDITRRDSGIPVVKALIPGMELMADFDRYSRVTPRLFRNYLKSNI